MTTPAAPNEEIVSVGSLPNDSARRPNTVAIGWFNTAMLIIGGVAAVGFLVVLVGGYLIDNVPAVLAGTIVVLIAAIAWIVVVVYWAANIVKRRFISDDKAKPKVQQSQ